MKNVLVYFILIVVVSVVALMITKAIVQSDLPLWLKIFLVK